MRTLIWILLLAPLALSAQLDRIHPGMAESDFQKKVPEAKRDIESEAQWVSIVDSLDDIPGESFWRIRNDSVIDYSFQSASLPGPSSEFTDVDSSVIHEVKETLDGLRREMEGSFGKPAEFRNAPLLQIGNDHLNLAYSVRWDFDHSEEVVIRLITGLGSPNRINAPMERSKPEAQFYTLEISISHQSAFSSDVFQMGPNTSRLLSEHPNLKDQLKPQKHVYMIQDTLRQDYDEWRFEFAGGKLAVFSYDLYLGEQYGGMPSEEAYKSTSRKAEQLLAQGNASFGKTDSLSNLISKEYNLPNMRAHHHIHHLYSRWLTTQGNVMLYFDEVGGGKEPGTFFHVAVQYGVYW